MAEKLAKVSLFHFLKLSLFVIQVRPAALLKGSPPCLTIGQCDPMEVLWKTFQQNPAPKNRVPKLSNFPNLAKTPKLAKRVLSPQPKSVWFRSSLAELVSGR